MGSSIKKSRKKSEIKNDFEFDEDDDIEVCNFSEGEPILEGTLLRSFVFDDSTDEPIEVDLTSANAAPIGTKTSNIEANENSTNETASNLNNKETSSKPKAKEDITDYRFSKSNPLGRTPPVDGEAFDMVRSYTLRRSTVRILSKIKAIHLDDNVYLNTIVDEAIRHYYEHLKNSNV
ncbi:hypothetical protein [Clostridium sp. C2-6-12]|uniref:hypothetical protein n=1 Tax=Clostridium sp. C2-6-12 TaxID=2698832 RepID=UPI001367F807|nr:hypothetical protein [Clostridium sp. C2-6-12]